VLEEPFRIFIGSDQSQTVAHQVLAYTIREHASIPVEITPMLDLPVRAPKDDDNEPRTGFSYYRFAIPELCGYAGRALYLDPDMLVLGDIAELAGLTFGDHTMLCTHQPAPPPQWEGDPKFRPGRNSAVMLLDCSRLHWDVAEFIDGLDDGRYTYRELVRELSVFGPDEIADTIPVEWNHLERYEPGVTRLLHYTVVSTQPWKTDANPLGELWTSWYCKAMQAGAVRPDDVAEGILAGHVKVSLAECLERAPGGSAALGNALLELGEARDRAAQAEARLEAVESSSSWRIGNAVVRGLHAVRKLAPSRTRSR
jgi:hypothetical protein